MSQLKDIQNNYPDFNIGALETDYNALMSIIGFYMNKYIYTCEPVQVASYKDGFVSVKPLIQNTTATNKPIPITDGDMIYNIPILKFKANGWKINFKCAEGDIGLLIACKRDITKYKDSHGTAIKGSQRTFSYSDGFFLPLDFSKDNEEGLILSNETTVLHLQKNSVNIEATEISIKAETANIEASTINLGGDSGQAVARVGDSVDLNTGKITSGSSIVKAS